MDILTMLDYWLRVRPQNRRIVRNARAAAKRESAALGAKMATAEGATGCERGGSRHGPCPGGAAEAGNRD